MRHWLPARGVRGWVALAALAVLLAAALADLGLWYARGWGGFSSKANFASHFWPYLALGGAVAGLLARGVPNALRSVPTLWLLASLALQHGGLLFPPSPLPPPAGPTLRVMTLNLGKFLERRHAATAFLRERRDVDVLFLQEVHDTEARRDRPAFEAALGGRLPHAAWLRGPTRGSSRFGLAILSRHPLREARAVPLPPGAETSTLCQGTEALVAKALVGGRAVRLATTHLCPPHVPWFDPRLRSVRVFPRSIWTWPGAIREVEYARRSQIAHLLLLAEGGVEPFILGGDLNTTPMSLDLLPLSRRLRSAFDERGLGFGYTFYVGPIGARIDHMFYSEGLRARSAAVAEADVSDHRPLEAVLEILPQAGGFLRPRGGRETNRSESVFPRWGLAPGPAENLLARRLD